MDSVRFWSDASTIEAMRHISSLMDRVPPAYVVETAKVDKTGAAAFDANNKPDPVTGLKAPFPLELIEQPQKLIISDEGFDQDYVFQGGIFVSGRLREVFDLDPRTVQYIQPDTSGSTANVIAADYMWMSVLVFRNAIDLERSERFSLPGVPASSVPVMKHVVFKDDFEADVPLFFDPNDQKLYATDEFADRVLRAGLKAIEFYDYSSSGEGAGNVRTKRIED